MSPFIQITPDLLIPMREIQFRFTRSGGPGGQNVNKVSTRVDLLFDIVSSESVNEEQRGTILSTLRTRIDSGGVLRLTVQESRSQMRNRELALERFASLLREALRTRKGRKKTKPTKTSRHKRIASKARRGATKKLRGRVDRDF